MPVTLRHSKRPPKVPQLLHLLKAHQVRYVLTGSVAAQAYGLAVEPGDLDITPALDRENLSRLADVLHYLEATIEPTGERWEMQPDGERKWIEGELTAELLAAQLAWEPDPDDVSTFDHLFLTRYGNFDVVPEISGLYESLTRRALLLDFHGYPIYVMHVDDLLVALTVPRRKKDVERVRQLRIIQHVQGQKSK